MKTLETERLVLRRLTTDDAPFIIALLNDPDWLRFIGDKSVHTLDEAREYLRNGPLAMYAREGFGLLLTALKDRDVPIGLCGLVRRDGFATSISASRSSRRSAGRGMHGKAPRS